MYSPTLGRFVTTDPIGFQAGDVNLYRFVSNDPSNATDPSGLAEVAPPPRLVVPVAPAPHPIGSVSEGEGDPPDLRDVRPPSITHNGKLYKPTGRANWDPVRFAGGKLTKVVFKNQRTELPDCKILRQDVEVTANGTRRFPGNTINDSGDHIAYVVVQIKFVNRTIIDNSNNMTKLPDSWKQIEFSLNYSVFLRSAQPPALDIVAGKLTPVPGESWGDFVTRFIGSARDIKR